MGGWTAYSHKSKTEELLCIKIYLLAGKCGFLKSWTRQNCQFMETKSSRELGQQTAEDLELYTLIWRLCGCR